MSKNWVLFKTFLLAGTFTFAGGIAMMPVLKKDIVDRHALLSEDDFLEYAVLSQSIPGVIALNFACLVGGKSNGKSGLIVASIGAIMPAFLLMLIATILYQYIPQEGPLQLAFTGIRAASASCVLIAATTLAKHNLKPHSHKLITLAAWIMIALLNVDAPLVILGAGTVGIVALGGIRR